MKRAIAVVIGCIVFLMWLQPTMAQQSVSAAGGNSTGTGGSVSYTIGQMDYLTITGTTGSAAQGVQQPFEIFQYVAVEQPDPELSGWQIFPNPATDYVIVRSQDPSFILQDQYFCQIFNISGKILIYNEIQSTETTIMLTGWSPGVYLLRISSASDTEHNYCIIIK
ncbi:MAG TPA: T9SS type A sorting domain-containing protein [Bacteroidales bacterium]|nr:T9SS type A sorting domain-containing protein [Bacteroidales bacterium]HRZ48077.1 T9SS type A sorting domain-containing protein [Bacteroidales bacterium]